MNEPKSEFSHFKAASLLTLSAAAGHFLTIAVLPFLTRIYTPEDFGVLAIMASLLSLCSAASGLRYEIAIPLADDNETAANLLAVNLICVLAIAMIVFAIVSVASPLIGNLLPVANSLQLLWLLPMGIVAIGFCRGFQYWTIRERDFNSLSRAKLAQSVFGNTAQILIGIFCQGALGLVLGQIVSQSAGLISLARRAVEGNVQFFRKVSNVSMLAAARRFEQFPKFSTLETVLNVAASELPIIVIAKFAATSEVGHLLVAMRIMQVPVTLVGSSVAQVFLSRAAAEHSSGNLANYTLQLVRGLAGAGIGPLLFLAIVSPKYAGPIFGPGWEEVGELVAWMTPWFVVQLLASPVSTALHVLNQQKTAMGLQLFGLLARVGLTFLAVAGLSFGLSPIKAFAISGFFFYVVYFIVLILATNVSKASLLQSTVSVSPIVVTWACAGILTRMVG